MVQKIKHLIMLLLKKEHGKEGYLQRLKRNGLVFGSNLSIQQGCIIDEDHCWHITIGSNVTLAPRVHILAHDASSFNLVGYTKVRNVSIGDNVFIGAGCIIMPGVKIVSNVIIGAGTIVFRDILEPGVYVGSSLRRISGFEDYKTRLEKDIENGVVFDESYTLRNPRITEDMKRHMKDAADRRSIIFVK